MRIHIASPMVIPANAFKLPVTPRTIVIDLTPIIVPQKNATPSAIRNRQLAHHMRAMINRHRDGKRLESPKLVFPLEKNGIVPLCLQQAATQEEQGLELRIANRNRVGIGEWEIIAIRPLQMKQGS